MATFGNGTQSNGRDRDADQAGTSLDCLTVRQEAAIIALLYEPTLESAARKAKVGERTLCRWLDEDARFIAGFRKARRVAFALAITACQRFAPTGGGDPGQRRQ